MSDWPINWYSGKKVSGKSKTFSIIEIDAILNEIQPFNDKGLIAAKKVKLRRFLWCATQYFFKHTKKNPNEISKIRVVSKFRISSYTTVQTTTTTISYEKEQLFREYEKEGAKKEDRSIFYEKEVWAKIEENKKFF